MCHRTGASCWGMNWELGRTRFSTSFPYKFPVWPWASYWVSLPLWTVSILLASLLYPVMVPFYAPLSRIPHPAALSLWWWGTCAIEFLHTQKCNICVCASSLQPALCNYLLRSGLVPLGRLEGGTYLCCLGLLGIARTGSWCFSHLQVRGNRVLLLCEKLRGWIQVTLRAGIVLIMCVLQVLEVVTITTAPQICVHLNCSVSVIAEQEWAGMTLILIIQH